jgi:alkylation response protein AidB-like acyl-CoA dehydrogenase
LSNGYDHRALSPLPLDVQRLLGLSREIASSIVAAHADSEDLHARWPSESMQALADARLLGLHVPKALGGAGLGLLALASVSESIAEYSASTALCYAMHCVGTAVIAAKATDHHKQAYLVPIAEGQHITTLALSEPGTGAAFYFPETQLETTARGFIVSGTKSFVTNGKHANSYVVSAAKGPNAEEGAFSCVLVDADRPGLEWQSEWRGFGMRSNSSRSVKLVGVEIPSEKLLGVEGDQLWYVFEVVAPYFLMAMAGTYLGVAQAAVSDATRHLGARRHSHSAELLGASPVLAHRLGSMWTTLEATRALIYRAASRADARDPDALPAVLACKAAAGDAAVDLTNEAMTLCGGIAYAENSRLARLLRDARASHVMSPTSDLLKTWVGRSLLKLPLI